MGLAVCGRSTHQYRYRGELGTVWNRVEQGNCLAVVAFFFPGVPTQGA